MGHDDQESRAADERAESAAPAAGVTERGARALLGAVVELLPQMVFVKDARDLRFVLLNAAGESLLGMSREEMLGRSDRDFFPDDQARFFMAKDRAVLESKRLYDIPGEPITTRNGHRVLHTRKVPVVDAETGEPLYLLGISEDITEQRQSTERTEHALREAREADAARAELLAVISHELRTPLTGMVGMASLLSRTPLSPAQAEMVQVLERSSTRLHKLITDLLDLSRLDTGHVVPDAVPYSPELAARDTVALFRQRADDRGIGLDVDLGDAVPPLVVGDASRVQQVLMNLVSNAVRHTHEGHVTIRLAWGRSVLRIDVIDTGDGIDPAHAGELFEPFRRGANAVGEGVGLGLAIARRLVSMMGGRIGAEAGPRGGSRFFFEVPAPRSDDDDISPTGRVLVVDDDSLSRRMAEVMLQGLGYDAVSVDSGEAALAWLAEHACDAVLMDRNLPGVDGNETTRRLRALDVRWSNVCVVGISAELDGAEKDAALEAGMNECLPKPYGVRELENALARWCAPVGTPPR